MLRLKAAAVALGLLALAACNGDPGSTPTAPRSHPTSSADAAASPNAPENAEQFVVRYISIVSQSLNTGDPSPFIALSGAECDSCRAVVRNLRRAYRDGGMVKGAQWRAVDAQGKKTEGYFRVRFTLVTDREEWLDGKGKLKQVYPPSRQPAQVFLSRTDGEWQVEDWELT